MASLLQQFQTNGYLVLENFNTAAECDAVMQRGEELANNFNFDGHPSVFQTTDQVKTSDDYFINSGDKTGVWNEISASNCSVSFPLMDFKNVSVS